MRYLQFTPECCTYGSDDDYDDDDDDDYALYTSSPAARFPRVSLSEFKASSNKITQKDAMKQYNLLYRDMITLQSEPWKIPGPNGFDGGLYLLEDCLRLSNEKKKKKKEIKERQEREAKEKEKRKVDRERKREEKQLSSPSKSPLKTPSYSPRKNGESSRVAPYDVSTPRRRGRPAKNQIKAEKLVESDDDEDIDMPEFKDADQDVMVKKGNVENRARLGEKECKSEENQLCRS